MSKRHLTLLEKLDSLNTHQLRTLLQRIYDETVIEQRRPLAEGPCFIYTKRHSSNGYGRISVCGKEHATHLIAYMILKGKIAPPYELDHTCYETACWNPEHLIPKTHAENCATRRSHGPHPNRALEDMPAHWENYG